MTALFGVSIGAFVGLTGGLFGLVAFLTGQAVADSWRPAKQAVASAFGLAVAARFLAFALFGGQLLSLTGFVIAWAYLAAVTLFAWRATLARKMVRQYPWLYAAQGILGWRRLDGDANGAGDRPRY
jgi:hypothetical protein